MAVALKITVTKKVEAVWLFEKVWLGKMPVAKVRRSELFQKSMLPDADVAPSF
jgi:hypothetical protein